MEGSLLVPKVRVEYFRKIKDKLNDLGIKISLEDNKLVYDCEDPYIGRMILTAIARGFDLENAMILQDPDYSLYIIDLDEFFNTQNRIRVIKGRVIGREGSIKIAIEEATNSKIAIFYNTIAVIAPYYSYNYVIRAINMLINGSKHASVLNFLSKAKDMIKLERLR